MKRIFLSIAAISINAQCVASMEHQGLGGELSVMAGYSQGKSNFNTDKSVKTGELNSAAESDSTAIPVVLGQLRYTFAENQLFIGTARSDIVSGVLALEAGYKRAIGQNSTLSFSYLPTIMKGETWADPFITDTEREVTDEKGDAYRFQYKNMFNTNLSADIAYFTREVENERSGATSFAAYQDQLKRDGDGLYAKLSGMLFISPAFMVQPAALMEDYSADGKAMSYSRYGGEVRFIGRGKTQTYTLTLGYSESEFDEINPVFNLLQEDEELKAIVSYEYNGFMGWKNLALSALLSYSEFDSNIDFYDKENTITALGVSYKF